MSTKVTFDYSKAAPFVADHEVENMKKLVMDAKELLVSKKGSTLESVTRLSEVNVTNPDYYRIRKIPAIGYFIKENLITTKQIGIEDARIPTAGPNG